MSQDKSAEPKQHGASPPAAKAPKGGAPAAALLIDPLELWRKALTEFEQRANELGSQSMRSPEIVQLMHQFSTFSSQYQNLLEQVLTRGLKVLNLPSRRDITELGDLMRQIDGKLDRLLPVAEPMAMPRPARTRRPSAEVEALAAATPSAPVAPRSVEDAAAPAIEAAPMVASAPVVGPVEAAEAAEPVPAPAPAAPAEVKPRRRAARSGTAAPGSRTARTKRTPRKQE